MLKFYNNFFFFLFSSLIFASALLVIQSSNAVHAVLFLILVFVNASALLLVAKIEFLAFMLIIIYVGAIAVLFLFVVMMLDIDVKKVERTNKLSYLFIVFLVGLSFFFETFFILRGTYQLVSYDQVFPDHIIHRILCRVVDVPGRQTFFVERKDPLLNLDTLGQTLYSYYAILFLLAGIVLLIALIGSVILTFQGKKKSKNQFFFKQLSRDPDNALLSFSNIHI